MTLERFDELIMKDAERREKLNAEINALLQKKDALEAAALADADAGDAVAYKAHIREKADIEADLFVKKTCLEKLRGTAKKEDAVSAWDNYSAGYNKRMKKSLAEFKAEKEKLCAMYSKLVSMQSEAFAVRERLGDAVGADVQSFDMETIPCLRGIDEPGVLKLGGVGVHDPDAAYYLSNYCRNRGISLVAVLGKPDNELERITNVIVNHHSN